MIEASDHLSSPIDCATLCAESGGGARAARAIWLELTAY